MHTERFALPHERAKYSSPTPADYGLLLGIDEFSRYLQINRPRLGNLLVDAPTGGGKTTLFKHQLIAWKENAIINDIKGGELYNDTADFRRQFSDVYVYDPTTISHKFNPLQGKTTEEDFYGIAKLLLYKHDEKDPSFTERAIRILKILFIIAQKTGEPPFSFVYRASRMGINSLTRMIAGIDRELAGRLVDGDYNAQKDYTENKYLVDSWSALTSRLEPFLTETVANSLSGSDFRIVDLLTGERPVTIYLKWPESKLFSLQPVMKLLWGTFINELRDHGNETTRKTMLLIDEGGVTYIPELQDAMATLNSRGVSFVIGIQELSQLDMYGKANAQTILGNCSKIFYEQESLETAKFVAERLGGKSAFSSSQSTHGEEVSEGKHEQKIPLMTPQEIMGMDETVIIFVRGLRYAIKARRMPEFVKPDVTPLLLPAHALQSQFHPPPSPSMPPAVALPPVLPIHRDHTPATPDSWELRFTQRILAL